MIDPLYVGHPVYLVHNDRILPTYVTCLSVDPEGSACVVYSICVAGPCKEFFRAKVTRESADRAGFNLECFTSDRGYQVFLHERNARAMLTAVHPTAEILEQVRELVGKMPELVTSVGVEKLERVVELLKEIQA